MRTASLWIIIIVVIALPGCRTRPAIETVAEVDLNQFMGDWYVIASIPTIFEKEVYNGVESYRLAEDGTIYTTFTFNKGAFDGPVKTYRPRAFVQDSTSNAVWGMQFVWPFKAEYRIIYLDKDYATTVVGHTKRDYVWIMARRPAISEADYDRILRFIAEQGYDISKVKKVPQSRGIAPSGVIDSTYTSRT